MGTEVVTVTIGGQRWTAFEQISVKAAFNEAARTCRIELACELGPSQTNRLFKVGTEIEIHANSDLLMRGYVDSKRPQIAATQALITVNGRSKSADLIDSSAVHKTGRFKNKTPLQIGNEVSEGISARYTTDQELEVVDQYQVTPGETTFRAVEKLARKQGMTVTGDADGNARITKASKQRHAGGLVEGVNLLTGTADHNGSNRFSKYTVHGQRPFGHGIDNLEIEAVIRDQGVERHRPVVIVQDDDTTKETAKKRAKNRRDRSAGHALKATISTQGFRDEGGKIWTPGWLVWTESATLDIAQDMLIESVSYQQSEQGSIAELSLTDPRSYGGKGSTGKGNKSGSEWKQDDSGPELVDF